MNESALIITDFSPIHSTSYEVLDKQQFDFEKLYFEKIKIKGEQLFYIQTEDPGLFFKELIHQVTFIKAAGGLVENDQNEYLFIKRLGKWDLPKGKLEEGERMRETAVREVEEECGVKVDLLGEKIKSTYHTYVLKDTLILKKTNWYDMKILANPKLIPQLEEDITEAKWVKRGSFDEIRNNTYPLIKELLAGM